MKRHPDSNYLDQIHEIMSGNEWSADTLDEIARVVEASGREIANSDELVS